jgi:hypothetical protein
MDRKNMTKQEMDDIIEKNKSIYEFSTRNWDKEQYDGRTERPDLTKGTKVEFIEEWISIIYPRLCDDDKFYQEFLKDSLIYTKKELQITFEWIYSHFLELGLGGNGNWFGVYRDLLDHLHSKTTKVISRNFERELKVKFIIGEDSTAWID